ncbi:MAG: chemotaxis protein CheW [gamma proteobacterium endosymbiont of Lamellibrachia anaximandri]|nr:chemotaxis protein CheW [gamma proteobacterium endosymbiont of Lamellibrachia anaximandri]MBL3600375.1 chemotaxis protein CheW [gamma proteobacterium endosymbiont of Lamellibrachia anaximandri]
MNEPQAKIEAALENQGDEYLTFRLGDEDYGVDILRVQEIRGWETATRIPNSPGYVKGVVNMRGSIVPIFDMRQRLGMEVRPYSKNTVVIVLRVKSDRGERNMGVVVDEVSDVLSTQKDRIRNTPEFGGGIATDYISGLADAGGKMIMLLDVDKLLNQGEQTESENEDAA